MASTTTENQGPSKGSGSVWNAGSWHWEEKNYTEWAHADIKDRIKGLLGESRDPIIVVTDVPSVTGSAAVNIRKGKAIPVLELTIKGKWEVVENDNTCMAEGMFTISDLMVDDIDGGDFEMKIEADKAKSGAAGAQAKDLIEKKLRGKLQEKLLAFKNALVEKASGKETESYHEAQKSAPPQETRQPIPNTAETTQASQTKPPQPQPISNTSTAQNESTSNSNHKDTAGGSVWNPNSYHWEEKSLTSWAKERVQGMFKNFDIDIPGGRITISEISDFHGEASVSIRKGKKLLFFEFEVKGEWEGEMVDGDGNVLATGDGQFHIPDLDQDTDIDDEMEIKVTAASDGGANDIELKEKFRQHGVSKIRELFQQFVDELRKK
eukprot:gb/GECG01014056.1/.p1 GENE.gb/GECG01014056.1/~~gb/GECG01014056.1/.p1  ORF type:complete len:379 (+),score=82.74 gb/GECG01014056.1/:1-1137(+)